MNNVDKKTFMIEDENGQTKEAEIITMVSLKNNRYLIYSISDKDNMSIVCASKVIKDDNDNDKLVDIEEGEDKEIIKSFISSLTK